MSFADAWNKKTAPTTASDRKTAYSIRDKCDVCGKTLIPLYCTGLVCIPCKLEERR